MSKLKNVHICLKGGGYVNTVFTEEVAKRLINDFKELLWARKRSWEIKDHNESSNEEERKKVYELLDKSSFDWIKGTDESFIVPYDQIAAIYCTNVQKASQEDAMEATVKFAKLAEEEVKRQREGSEWKDSDLEDEDDF